MVPDTLMRLAQPALALGYALVGVLTVAVVPVYHRWATDLSVTRPAGRDAPAVAPSSRPRPAEPVSLAIPTETPFRAGHRPARVRYGETPPPPPPAAVPTPRPALLLTGVVLGPNPMAVVEGLPGTAGAVVWRVGQRMGALELRVVDRSRVTIVGPDTSWNLFLRRSW